jgi:hypothetical protein
MDKALRRFQADMMSRIMRPGVTFFVFGICAVLLCRSQPPSPAPTKAAHHDQGKTTSKDGIAADEDRNSESIPAAIDKLTSEVASWKQKSNTAPENHNPSSEWWLKGSTIVSAVATLFIAVLACVQGWVMHRQRVAMDLQADYMREALGESHRAFLKFGQMVPAQSGGQLKIAINNGGDVPAKITDIESYFMTTAATPQRETVCTPVVLTLPDVPTGTVPPRGEVSIIFSVPDRPDMARTVWIKLRYEAGFGHMETIEFTASCPNHRNEWFPLLAGRFIAIDLREKGASSPASDRAHE